jgi:acyl carrier protein
LQRTDICNRTDIEELSSYIKENFDRVDGIIHAAGDIGIGTIATKSKEQANQVFDPRIAACIHISECLLFDKPDFLFLCSSLASITGGYGQSDYSAANAYFDTFALYCNYSLDIPSFSINWDAWKDIGKVNKLKSLEGSHIEEGISTEEGLAILDMLFSSGRTGQIAVSTSELESRIRKASSFGEDRNNLLSVDEERSEIPTRAKQKSDTTFIAPSNEFEQSIAILWQEILGVEHISMDDDFFTLGGHSLLAIQQISRLQETYGVELNLADLFKDPTVAGVAQLLEETLLSQIEEISEEEAERLLHSDD